MKNRTYFSILLCVVFASFAFLSSCATSRLEVPLTRPAEINTSKFKRVFVGDFKNATSLPNPQGKMEFALTNALTATGKFDVLDKEAYENFIKGGKTKNDDILVINGTVSRYKGGDVVTQGQPYKDKEGKTYINYTRTAAISYGVQFKVSQASDAKILGTREVVKEVSDSQTATNAQPGYIDMDNLLASAEDLIIREFLKKIVPYKEIVAVDLYSDKDLPQLDEGIKAARQGSWEAATSLFKEALDKSSSLKPEQQAIAAYDLGVAEMLNNEFASARKHFSLAVSKDGKKSEYSVALRGCDKLESDYKKVQEQNK